jgi:hypothetical protein
MDSRISNASRPDVVLVDSAPRPTAAPVRVSFGQLLAAGAGGLVQGAEAAATRLPGAPLAAAAVRAVASGGMGAMSTTEPGVARGGLSALSTPEGLAGSSSPGIPLGAMAPGAPSAPSAPTAPAAPGATTDPSGGIDASLQQSAQLNLYYLQVQQQVDAQNRSFTALSNVLKTEHDSAKAAIQNIHS